MEKPKIHVILGSVREGRAGEKVANWFMQTIQNTTEANIELVDLLEYPLPLFADATPPSTRQGAHSNPQVQKWLDKINEADGYIIITPEYNHGVAGPLKNAIDYGYKEWNGKAIGFVSYGGLAGGSRAVEHLRQIATELQMHDVRDQVMIPVVWTAFDEHGKLAHAESLAKSAQTLVERITELASQLQKK